MAVRPLPNRVAPDGSLFSSPARGLLLGNRGGRFHNPQTQELGVRRWASRAWICCLLSFKERDRSAADSRNGGIWGHGYTELFFCDEVTALAAGHRPCMECRRADALAYRSALVAGLGLTVTPSFPEMIDCRLDAERRNGRAKRVLCLFASSLPDGTMLAIDGDAFAVRAGMMLRWTPDGYGDPVGLPEGPVSVLTPATSLAALAAGYRPIWHSSAKG